MVVAVYRDPQVVGHWMEDLKASVSHGVRWVKNGFKLFAKNMQISKRLVWKSAMGHQLTLRESKLLVTTTSDIFKLVPFSLFIIIPFAELALPIFLRIFPNMLPSTFIEKSFDSGQVARRVRAKKELAEFFESVIEEKNKNEMQRIFSSGKFCSGNDKMEELYAFRDLLAREQFPSVKEIVRFAKLFEEEFKLENMRIEHLQKICKMLGIEPFGFKSHVVLQLRHYVNRLQAEDRRIVWEGGVDTLDDIELQEACFARGIHPPPHDFGLMKKHLEHWLELSSTRQVPTSLLLWSRAFIGSSSNEAEKLVEPVIVVTDTTTATAEINGEEIFEDTAERQKERAEDVERRLSELEELDKDSVSSNFATEEKEDESREELIDVNRKLHEELATQAQIVDKQEAVLDDVIMFVAKMQTVPWMSTSVGVQNRERAKKIRRDLREFTIKLESDMKEIDAMLKRTRPVIYIEKDQRFYPSSDDEDSDDEDERHNVHLSMKQVNANGK